MTMYVLYGDSPDSLWEEERYMVAVSKDEASIVSFLEERGYCRFNNIWVLKTELPLWEQDGDPKGHYMFYKKESIKLLKST